MKIALRSAANLRSGIRNECKRVGCSLENKPGKKSLTEFGVLVTLSIPQEILLGVRADRTERGSNHGTRCWTTTRTAAYVAGSRRLLDRAIVRDSVTF